MATKLNPNPTPGWASGLGPSIDAIPNMYYFTPCLAVTFQQLNRVGRSGEKGKQCGGVFVYHYCGFFASESASDPFRFAGAKIEEDKKWSIS